MKAPIQTISKIMRPLVYVVIFICALFLILQPITREEPHREFGVVGDSNTLKAWSKKTGTNPTMPVEFEAWSNQRILAEQFEQAKNGGYRSYMITWEPWQPIAANLELAAQNAEQTLYTNEAIANGTQDVYIRQFAESVARSGLETIYIRYAHEVNGNWYPWSRDNIQFIKAWQHIVSIFRSVGASNAKFVYSTNPNLYQSNTAWTSGFWKYWPGDTFVDYIGSTMINFGSNPCSKTPCGSTDKGYSVELFKSRILLEHSLTHKPLIISELNTALQDDTEDWLSDLNKWLIVDKSWVKGVVLSQLPSRGAQQMHTGNLSWNISDQPDLYPVIRTIISTINNIDHEPQHMKSVSNTLMLK